MRKLDVGVTQQIAVPRTIDGNMDAELKLASEEYCLDASAAYCWVKRGFDLLLPFLLPVFAVLALVIKCTSSGPVFFRHRRIGQHGKVFYLYKFRTMVPDGDRLLRLYLAENPEARKEWAQQHKLRFDPRITPVGRVLRRTSLDELPQIFNVFRGEMSFVGPRPIVREEIHRYGDSFSIYAAARPGITGLWQVSGRGELSYEERVAMDVEYVRTWSLLGDLRMLMKTSHAVLKSKGAF
jgi:lipopolysaccharide/colanic/teichoic acid biosynthesis glycosyltransferase